MPYWYQSDMEGLIGQKSFANIFSDGNLGTVNSTYLAEIQVLADSEVDAQLATEFPQLQYPIIQAFPNWAPNTSYPRGAFVQQVTPAPPVPAILAFRQIVPAGGVSAGTEPKWPTLRTKTIADGGAVWLAISATPELVRMASLRYGRAICFERHPDYARRYADRPRKEADAFMRDKVLTARAYFTDMVGPSKPANTGATYRGPGRMIYSGHDPLTGRSNGGDY